MQAARLLLVFDIYVSGLLILDSFQAISEDFKLTFAYKPLSQKPTAQCLQGILHKQGEKDKLKFKIYYPLISNFFWKYFYSYCHCYCYFGPATIYPKRNTHLLDYLDKKQHSQSLKKFSDSELSLAIANKISECELNLATAN